MSKLHKNTCECFVGIVIICTIRWRLEHAPQKKTKLYAKRLLRQSGSAHLNLSQKMLSTFQRKNPIKNTVKDV